MRVMRAIVMLAPVVLAGCISTENDDPSIGGKVHLEFMDPSPPPALDPPPPPPSAPLTRIDRADWQPVLLAVPNRVIAHGRPYASRIGWTRATRRQRGEYPTPESAMQLDGGPSAWPQRGEAVVAPFKAAADLVLAVPRFAGPRRFGTMYSPRGAYERYWLEGEAALPAGDVVEP